MFYYQMLCYFLDRLPLYVFNNLASGVVLIVVHTDYVLPTRLSQLALTRQWGCSVTLSDYVVIIMGFVSTVHEINVLKTVTLCLPQGALAGDGIVALTVVLLVSSGGGYVINRDLNVVTSCCWLRPHNKQILLTRA